MDLVHGLTWLDLASAGDSPVVKERAKKEIQRDKKWVTAEQFDQAQELPPWGDRSSFV